MARLICFDLSVVTKYETTSSARPAVPKNEDLTPTLQTPVSAYSNRTAHVYSCTIILQNTPPF